MVHIKWGKPKEWGLKLLNIFIKVKTKQPITEDDIINLPSSVDGKPSKQMAIEAIDDIIYSCDHLDIPKIQAKLENLINVAMLLPEGGMKNIILDKLIRCREFVTPEKIGTFKVIASKIKVDIEKGVN